MSDWLGVIHEVTFSWLGNYQFIRTIWEDGAVFYDVCNYADDQWESVSFYP